MTMITNLLSAIVVFFSNLINRDNRTEADKVHDFIDTEISMVSNEIVLDKLHALVDSIVSDNDELTAKDIAAKILQRVNDETRSNSNCTARYTYYKAFGLLTRYVVTVVNHDTKDIQKYRTYSKKNVSREYILKKYGIFVASVDESIIDMQFTIRTSNASISKFKKKRYSRNCVCTG